MSSPELPNDTRMPDPIDVARRIARITDSNWSNPDSRIPTGFRQDVFFDASEEDGLSQATLRIRRYSAKTRVIDGQEVSAQSRGDSRQHIGYFNPATEEWVLYPECILPEEQIELAKELEEIDQTDRVLKQISAVHGEPFIDARHPLTIEANKKMAQVLHDTGLAARLLRDNPVFDFINRIRADECTMARLLLTSVVNDQDLAVAYEGAILTNEAGDELRYNPVFVVASRNENNPAFWLPNLEVISVEEWKQLEHVPEQLLGYRQGNPNFSPEYCAVVHDFNQQAQEII